MTAGDHYPQIFPGLGGGVLVVHCLLLAACGLGSGGWCRYGWYWLFRLTWVMLQIVSYIDYYSVYTFYICALFNCF